MCNVIIDVKIMVYSLTHL